MTDSQDDRADQPPTEGVRGGSADEHPDVDSTTGSGAAERDEHVGRVAGDDVGYAGETGAERRAEG